MRLRQLAEILPEASQGEVMAMVGARSALLDERRSAMQLADAERFIAEHAPPLTSALLTAREVQIVTGLRTALGYTSFVVQGSVAASVEALDSPGHDPHATVRDILLVRQSISALDAKLRDSGLKGKSQTVISVITEDLSRLRLLEKKFMTVVADRVKQAQPAVGPGAGAPPTAYEAAGEPVANTEEPAIAPAAPELPADAAPAEPAAAAAPGEAQPGAAPPPNPAPGIAGPLLPPRLDKEEDSSGAGGSDGGGAELLTAADGAGSGGQSAARRSARAKPSAVY